MLINSTGIEYPAVLTDLELVDLRGDTLVSYPVIQHPYLENQYNVSTFIPPDQYFYVKVSTYRSRSVLIGQGQ